MLGLQGLCMPRVLVVDDDAMACVAVEACFQRQGLEVTVADGGDAGICALESSASDVMLVDAFMPHGRGFESIRVFGPTIRPIAISDCAFTNLETPPPDFPGMTLELGAHHVACANRLLRTLSWPRPTIVSRIDDSYPFL
jgi:DNA-binding NarL/FixJ family response regulator